MGGVAQSSEQSMGWGRAGARQGSAGLGRPGQGLGRQGGAGQGSKGPSSHFEQSRVTQRRVAKAQAPTLSALGYRAGARTATCSTLGTERGLEQLL